MKTTTKIELTNTDLKELIIHHLGSLTKDKSVSIEWQANLDPDPVTGVRADWTIAAEVVIRDPQPETEEAKKELTHAA